MRILIASVVRQAEEIYLPHLETIQWQDVDAEFDYIAYNDGMSDRAIAEILAFGGKVENPYPRPFDAHYEVTEETHVWSVPAFHWLAIQKQIILQYAIDQEYDALFLVDSDLLLGPETLRLTLEFGREVVSPVFWTRFSTDREFMPQVWETHPGNSSDAFVANLRAGIPQLVAGLGAATMIRSSAFKKVGWWPLIHGLPGGVWQGEDRHFCLRASANNVDLWAYPKPNIFHCYRPSDVQSIPIVMQTLNPGSHHGEGTEGDEGVGAGPRARPDGRPTEVARLP